MSDLHDWRNHAPRLRPTFGLQPPKHRYGKPKTVVTVAGIEDAANEVDSERAHRAGCHEIATWCGEANEHRERCRQVDISEVRSRRGVTDAGEVIASFRISIAADHNLATSLTRECKLELPVSVGDSVVGAGGVFRT